MDPILVEKYAWDGRCPSIRAQVLANPSRFQELMPAQYAQMMYTVQQRAKLDKWRAEALADIEHQKVEFTAEIRTSDGDYIDLQEMEADIEAARAEVEAEYKRGIETATNAANTAEAYGKRAAARVMETRRTKTAAANKADRERKLLAAEIARETLAQTSAANEEIARLKAELAATKAELAMMAPKKGPATPALAALRK
jgi:hypothetical protein